MQRISLLSLYNNDTATGWENSGILTYWYTGQCDCDDSIIDACGECGGDNVSCGIIVGDKRHGQF